jgi:hypothetical protein
VSFAIEKIIKKEMINMQISSSDLELGCGPWNDQVRHTKLHGLWLGY